jgi:hypothetical protein
MAFAVPKLEREESVKHCVKHIFEFRRALVLEASVNESEQK